MPPSESVLLIAVPEAEPLVAELRDRYDPVAVRGVPAHVTVLFPFKAPDDVTGTDLENLDQTFAAFAAFDFELAAVNSFPGVWFLAPEPAGAFKALTRAVHARFPDYPPYRGAFGDDSVPHLTVAQVADTAEFETVGSQLKTAAAPILPLRVRAEEVWLMDNTTGRWTIRRRFPLG